MTTLIVLDNDSLHQMEIEIMKVPELGISSHCAVKGILIRIFMKFIMNKKTLSIKQV